MVKLSDATIVSNYVADAQMVYEKKQFSQKWGQTPYSGKKVDELFEEIARAA